MHPTVPAPPLFADEPLRFGPLELPTRFALAPLAGHANLPFRLAARELGGLGLASTDMLNARALVAGARKTLYLAETAEADRPLAGQIYGPVPEELAAAAQWLEAHGFDVVDINMGCPARKIVRRGNGAALLREPKRAIAQARAVVEAVAIPVTVKMRLGWDAEHITAPALAREFEQMGVASVTVHGRTRGQFYKGEVDLAGIRAVVAAVEHMPVIGNGDVTSVSLAARMFQTTGCAGLAIGRGAMRNPFLFQQLHRWAIRGTADEPGPEPTFEQRLAFAARHFQLLHEFKGEHLACHMIRKFATYYRKMLTIPRDIYMQLVEVESAERFHELLNEIRSRDPAQWPAHP